MDREEIIFTRYLVDTVDYRIPESEYKVLVYVDSAGCTSCKLQLPKWKELMVYMDSVTGKTIPFLFFIHSNNYWEMRYLLKQDDFNIPICIDTNDELNKLNRFLPYTDFQTFLLDKDNKVIVAGNPVQNLAVKDLYLKQINGQGRVSSGQVGTNASADVNSIDMGSFEKLETKQAVFTLRNTGNKPLVIADIAVTCGCAAVKFDKHPAAPGETLKIVVDMNPKDSGFFNETITVKTNTKEYIKLTIRGQAS
jgi:hypothetical protein